MKKQLSYLKILWYHFYPGILLTLFFVILAPLFQTHGIPPQFIILIGIPIVILPTLYFHLAKVKKIEKRDSIMDLITYKEELPKTKLWGYTLGLLVYGRFTIILCNDKPVIRNNELLSFRM